MAPRLAILPGSARTLFHANLTILVHFVLISHHFDLGRNCAVVRAALLRSNSFGVFSFDGSSSDGSDEDDANEELHSEDTEEEEEPLIPGPACRSRGRGVPAGWFLPVFPRDGVVVKFRGVPVPAWVPLSPEQENSVLGPGDRWREHWDQPSSAIVQGHDSPITQGPLVTIRQSPNARTWTEHPDNEFAVLPPSQALADAAGVNVSTVAGRRTRLLELELGFKKKLDF